MAKQLGTGAKVAIWIGVLATVGVSGYFIHQAYKKWKANKNGGNDQSQDDGDFIPSEISAPVASGNTITSFDKLKNSIKSIAGYKNFVTYVVITSTPAKLGINATKLGINQNDTVKLKFTNGSWGLWKGDIVTANRIALGNYKNGGEIITVHTGRNVGLQTEGKYVLQNIAKAVA